MFKRKKFLIAISVLVMMLAMSVTAFAATRSCSLSASQTGAAYTSELRCHDFTHYSGYNSKILSTNDMVLEFQMQNVDFSWDPDITRNVVPGQYVSCDPIDVSGTWTGINFRTKIYSYGRSGGVDGTGCVFDY